MADTNVNGVDAFNIKTYLDKLRAANESYGLDANEKDALGRASVISGTNAMKGTVLGALLGNLFNDTITYNNRAKKMPVETITTDSGTFKTVTAPTYPTGIDGAGNMGIGAIIGLLNSALENVEQYKNEEPSHKETDTDGGKYVDTRTFLEQLNDAKKKMQYYDNGNPTAQMKDLKNYVLDSTSVNSFLKNLRNK